MWECCRASGTHLMFPFRDGDLLANLRMGQVRGRNGALDDRIKLPHFCPQSNKIMLVLVTKAKSCTYVLKVLGISAGW